MAIYLIRHAETDGNAKRVIQHPHTPLSERGRRQADKLGQRLQSVGILRIVASDHVRARMTAEAIARTTAAPIVVEAELQERNFGDLRGVAYADLTVDPFAPDYVPPNGESWPAFHQRVDRAWTMVQAVAADTAGHLAVVTHGLFCMSLATRRLTLGPGMRVPGGWGNTSVTILDAAPPHHVALLDCTTHLDARVDGGRA